MGTPLKQTKPSTHMAQRNLIEERTYIYRVRDKEVAETGQSSGGTSQGSERAWRWTSTKRKPRTFSLILYFCKFCA